MQKYSSKNKTKELCVLHLLLWNREVSSVVSSFGFFWCYSKKKFKGVSKWLSTDLECFCELSVSDSIEWKWRMCERIGERLHVAWAHRAAGNNLADGPSARSASSGVVFLDRPWGWNPFKEIIWFGLQTVRCVSG